MSDQSTQRPPALTVDINYVVFNILSTYHSNARSTTYVIQKSVYQHVCSSTCVTYKDQSLEFQ